MELNIELEFPSLILIPGQSGSGKETLMNAIIRLCIQFGKPYFNLSTGALGRDCVTRGSYIGQQIGKLNAAGKRFPKIAGMGMIFNVLENKFTGKEVVVLEGAPRAPGEYELIRELVESGLIPSMKVIEPIASDSLCKERMITRTEQDHRPGLWVNDHVDISVIENILRWWTEERQEILRPAILDGAYIGVQNEGTIEELSAQLIPAFRKK